MASDGRLLMKPRLAVLATHPIQYQAPLWQTVASRGKIDLKVFYASSFGVQRSLDPGFGEEFAWDVPLLEGYEHEFVPSVKLHPFGGVVGGFFPKAIGRRLREGGFDAVLVHGYVTGAAWAGMLGAWRSGISLIMRGDTHERGRRQFLRSRLKRSLLRPLMKRVDGVVAIGSWNEEYWLRHGVPANRIAVSLFAVDNDFFAAGSREQAPRAGALRAKWGADFADTVFLFCAKLIDFKAPDTLLRAFKALGADHAHLVFVGAGRMEVGLKQLERELGVGNVHWEGFVNQSSLPAYYRAADVMVLPSRDEPWGLVVNEALACGTPCLVSGAAGASADLVGDAGTGLVFPVDDVAALTRALREACLPDRREAWKRRIPAVLKRASLADNAMAIEQMVGSLVTRRDDGEERGRDGARP